MAYQTSRPNPFGGGGDPAALQQEPSEGVALSFQGFQLLVSPEDAPLLLKHKWRVNKCGYVIASVDGVEVLLHRVILDAEPGQFVDHISGDRADNRRENLRLCTHAENMRNRKTHSNNKLGVKGVYFLPEKGSYRAQIRANGRRHMLGNFKTVEQAKEAYNKAAAKLHGDFARTT